MIGDRDDSPWRVRDFRLLFGAQMISLLGSGATTVGLALLAHRLVEGPSATVVIGNALMLRIVAFLLVSQFAGIAADRSSRKAILVAADLARFGLVAIFPFVTAVWQVYALVFLTNALTALFTPTFEASIPDVVGDSRYVKALALSRAASDVESLVSPAVTALVVSFAGLRWVFWFDAGTYLASAVLVLAAHLAAGTRGVALGSWRRLLIEVSTGTRLLLREPSLRQALLLSFAEATAGATAIVATASYVDEVLKRGETTFALCMAVLGLGSTAAALLLGHRTGLYERGIEATALHARRHRWAEASLLTGGSLLGLVLLPGLLRPPLLVFGLLWLLNGAGQALIAIPSSTLLAEHIPVSQRGRAYAAHFALTHACWLVTYPAIGHAAKWLGTPATFSAAGVVCMAITAIAAVIGRGPRGLHRHEGVGVAAAQSPNPR